MIHQPESDKRIVKFGRCLNVLLEHEQVYLQDFIGDWFKENKIDAFDLIKAWTVNIYLERERDFVQKVLLQADIIWIFGSNSRRRITLELKKHLL